MKLRKPFICLYTGLLIAGWIATPVDLAGQRFTAGVVAGFNASQIDGDDLAGFDKIGLTTGIRATWETPSVIDFNIEFLYSERGSRPDIFNPEYDPDIKVSLAYAEIPVYVSLSDWWQEEGEYHKVSAHAGLSYGRLFSARTTDYANPAEESFDKLVPFFSDNDLSWLVGATVRFSPRWGITGRYTRGITPLLDSEKHDLALRRLLTYYLSFRLEYSIK